MRARSLASCALVLVGCAGEPDVTSAATVIRLAQAFTLSPGDAAELPSAGLVLRFDHVREDSRCPVDVDCVWEGDATVLLSVRVGESPAQAVELHTTLEPRHTAAGSLRVELLTLDPLPISDRSIDPSSYRATLRVVTAQQ